MDTASCTPPASSGARSRVDSSINPTTQNCSSTAQESGTGPPSSSTKPAATQGRCSSRAQGSSSSTAARLSRTLFCGAQRRRSEQAQAAIDKRMLLFWPWFVESAFQQHYDRTTLGIADAVCLPLDILIWVLVSITSGGQLLCLACALPPLLVTVAVVLLRHQQPELYTRRRTALTALRRLGIVPVLSLVLLRRPHYVTGSWAAAMVHLLVLSGSMHSLIAPFFFLNNWWTAMCEAVLTAVVLGTAAPAACTNMLAGPQPYAGWRAAAGLMDKAALNLYSSKLQDPALEHAVCTTTLNTLLVTACCLSTYLLRWFELQQRLRYKSQLPPAVAAMQGHLYGLPPGLMVAQALLLLLHPAMVLAWITCGAWHGLLTASS